MARRDEALRYFKEQESVWKPYAEAGIEKNRKGDALIRLTPKDGKLPEGMKLRAVLKNHEFRFGANLFMLDEFETGEKNAAYRAKFPELFNLGTVPFYWSDLEPEKGHPRFAKDSPRVYRRPATDLCVDYCLENRIEPKCHCLNYDSFLPSWLKNSTIDEHKQALSKRFAEIAERYAGSIPSFEVTNETLQSSPRLSPFFHADDFLAWSWRAADRFFPDNRLIINDYNIWFPDSYNDRHLYYMQIERLLAQGISHLDSIGMQFHSFVPREGEPALALQRYNPDHLFRLMDLYARLGKAEQITEMTIPAYSGDAEDEAIQAELLTSLYTVFFSHPAMEAVIYWNFVDGYAYRAEPGDMTAGENVYYGGLLRFDLSEKPAFTALKNLIRNTWSTDVTVPVVNGEARFRGFYGDYDLILTDGEHEIPLSARFSAHGRADIDVTV